jgi:predicted nucleotidyltransferase
MKNKILELKKKGHLFKTGSRVFGVHGKNSDVDYCVLNRYLSKFDKLLDELKIEKYKGGSNNTQSGGYKFRLGKKMINLIFLDEESFEGWKKATKFMMKTLEYFPRAKEYISVKYKRVKLFEFYKEMCCEKKEEEFEADLF